MPMPKRAAKRDANEKEIVRALEAVGASVVRISMKGVFDLLVGFRGATYLIDCKSRTKGLTPAQVEWLRDWRGGTAGIARSADDALRLIGAIDEVREL